MEITYEETQKPSQTQPQNNSHEECFYSSVHFDTSEIINDG